jgi:hypothetical protein
MQQGVKLQIQITCDFKTQNEKKIVYESGD